MTMSLVGVNQPDSRLGTTAIKTYKRKKSTHVMTKKHCKSSLNITMDSMAAMSNIITPAAEARLDESNEMLI